MTPEKLSMRASLATIVAALATQAVAQQPLPAIEVGKHQRQAHAARKHPTRAIAARSAAPVSAPMPAPPASAPPDRGSLTVPSVVEQKRELLQTVGSVAFVDTNTPELQTRTLDDLHDALKDVPGVYSESRYGQEMRLSVRGSNLTRDYHLRGEELLQDGTPMNYFDGGGDFYQVDPRYYRSIEVLKGGNALSYGSGTLGGAINLVSPTAYTAVTPNLLVIEGGSYGSVRGQAQLSRIYGDVDFLVNGTFSHSDGYREHSKLDYTQLNGNLGYRFSNNLETRFYWGVYDTWQQLPGTLSLSDAMSFPYLSTTPYIGGPGPFGLSGDQGRYVKNERVSNKTTYTSDFGRLDVDSWFMHNYLYHPVFVIIEQNGSTWGFAPKLTKSMEIAGHRDELVIGGRLWGGGSTDDWFSNYNGMIVNPYGLVPPSFGTAAYSFPPYSYNGLAQFGAANSCFGFCGLFINPGISAQIRNNRMSALNREGYFENRFYLDPQLALMFGAKIYSDTRSYTVAGGIPYEPLANNAQMVYRGLLPKVGLKFEPAKDIQFFADMTGSRDVPDFIDLSEGAFPPLQNGSPIDKLNQQKAWTGEIGSRGRWDRYAWDVTFYHSELQDELLKFNTDPTGNAPGTTFNAKRTMHQGVEAMASVVLWKDFFAPNSGDQLKLTQLWTWNDFRFVDDPIYGNNPIAGIPRHVLRTTLAYSRPDGLYVAPSLDWVPQGVYADYMHTLEAPGYVLIGAQAGYKLPHGVSIYLDARNLANRHYVSDVTTIVDARGIVPQIFYPGNGRSISAGAKLAF